MIIGQKNVTDAIERIGEMDLERGISQSILLVQEEAKTLCRVSTGELRNSIFTDVNQEGNTVRGTCYTNKEYAQYVEFGTGPAGQASHEGVSPNVAVAYRQSPWWIHEGSGPNEIDRETAETYHFPYVDTSEGRFYRCTGQPASPFMYPALKNNEESIIRIIREEANRRR